MSNTHSISRYELIALLGALLVAVFIRWEMLDRVAIDHFDEGVYSSNTWFAGTPTGHYPMRHLYAPPLLPAAIEWCQVFLGPTTLASLLPSLVTGCLTVFLVWWLLRKWYGPDAALIGAWLAAMSDFHAIYSQMALTDVPLGCFLLLAVGLGIEAILRGGMVRIALAGIVTGLAWWTKYNGWLPLAIMSSGTVAWLVIHRSKTVSVWRAAYRWMLVTIVAATVWSPVWFGLQDTGGYAAVAANHKGYVNPLREWAAAMLQQVTNHQLLESGLTWVSVPLALIIGGLLLAVFDSRFTWKPLAFGAKKTAVFKLVCGVVVLGMGGMRIGTSACLAIIALGGLAGSLFWPMSVLSDKTSSDGTTKATQLASDRRTLATWMVAAWLIGMMVATPAYRPYPRLTLPLLIATWLGASIGLAWWIRATRNVLSRSTGTGVSRVWTGLVGVGGLCFMANLAVFHPSFDRPELTQSSGTSLLNMVAEIEQKLDGKKFVAFTYGEPAVMHILNSLGHPAAPTVSLSPGGATPGYEQLVIVGDQARRSDEFEAQWSEGSSHLESILVTRFQMSEVVALNDKHTAEILLDHRIHHRREDAPEPPMSQVEVFRVVR